MSKRKKRSPSRRPPIRPTQPQSASDVAAAILRAAREPQLTSAASAPHRPEGTAANAQPQTRVPAPALLPPTPDGEQEPLVYGVAPTYWLHVDSAQTPRPSAIRFLGRRVDEDGHATGERFESQEGVPDLPAGIGWVSVTTRVAKLRAGRWQVEAIPVGGTVRASAVALPPPPRRVRLPDLPGLDAPILTARLASLTHGPGVLPLVWPLLVFLGVVIALVTQALLVRRTSGDVSTALLIGGASTVAGYLAAKTYYMVQHHVSLRGFVSAGTCIQGFLIGAFGTVLLLASRTDTPVLRLVDLTTPGVFFAMALGRPGCWFGGCCAGRPTTSRWGLWSSDRRIGIRRLPVQLLEAALALAVGLTGLALELFGSNRPAGVLIATSAGLYTLGRQALFLLRQEQRRTTALRVAATACSAVAALLGFVVAVL